MNWSRGMINKEKTQSNKIKREVCDSIKNALRNRKVDDSIINRFEDVFWKETQGYSFNRRKTYSFDDFKLETDNRSLILHGEHGMKLQMSIFNPLVPVFYRDKALEVLNEFLSKHSTITVTSTDSLAVMLKAYIDETVKFKDKYRLVIYLWNEEVTVMEKGYVISDAILPTDEHFAEFEKCVMTELRYLTLGK